MPPYTNTTSQGDVWVITAPVVPVNTSGAQTTQFDNSSNALHITLARANRRDELRPFLVRLQTLAPVTIETLQQDYMLCGAPRRSVDVACVPEGYRGPQIATPRWRNNVGEQPFHIHRGIPHTKYTVYPQHAKLICPSWE